MKYYIFIVLFSIISINSIAKEYDFNDLYKIAVKKDLRLSDFQYSYKVLKAQLSKVEAALYPKLTYSITLVPMGEVDTDTPSGSIDDMNFSKWGVALDNNLNLVQPIYTFGKWSTGMEIAKKRAEIETKKLEKIKQNIKFDLIKAYQALVMINELQSITSYGKKQVDKALKKMKELDEEDSDEYNESDYFKLKIYQQKIIDGENELKSLESQIRYGLITLLDIDKDFKIKDKKIKPMPLVEEWDYKSMVEYQMLMELIDISRLNLNLQKNYFTPDIFFWVSWHFKYSNVAPYSSGYDPYHSNIAGAGLGLRWNLDFMQLKANYRIAKIQLLQNENRVELLKKKSSIEDFKIKSEAILLKQKIDVQKNISKESKRWFTGNAMDYYAGIGSSKSLLDSLAEYQKSKISLIRAIYNYNIKISNLKLFRGEK